MTMDVMSVLVHNDELELRLEQNYVEWLVMNAVYPMTESIGD